MATPLASSGVQSRPEQTLPVQKHLFLRSDEWAKVARRMNRVGETNFSRFTRQLLIHGRAEPRASVDEQTIIRHLGWIGNNINQIARKANSADVVTRDMALETAREFEEIRALVVRAYGKRAGSGSRQSTQHIQDS